MGEEKQKHELGVSLLYHIEERFKALDMANTLFMKRLDDRLETMNEFREENRQQTAHFVTRNEFELSHDRVLEDIRFLRESRATLAGKASQTGLNIAFLIGILGLAIGIIGFFI